MPETFSRKSAFRSGGGPRGGEPDFRQRTEFLRRWWKEPQAYPDEFKSWLLNFIEHHPELRLEEAAIPPLHWDKIIDPPPGGAGSDANYVHTQSTLAATWVVTHSLGKYPSVSVIDTGGSVVLADVIYDDLDSVRIGFSAPTSGKAVFN